MEHTDILPEGGTLASIALPPGLPPSRAARIASVLLNKHSPHEIAEAVEIMVDVLDLLGGDPEAEVTDAEDDFAEHGQQPWNGAGCAITDPGDTAYVEWLTMRGSQKRGPNIIASDHEDDEEDDPPEEDDDDSAVDDNGCDDINDDREQECDGEQMPDDVPMLPVVSLEYNIFNDQRKPLGISNLMSSFVAGGVGVRSADTGALHRGRAPDSRSRPGSPV